MLDVLFVAVVFYGYIGLMLYLRQRNCKPCAPPEEKERRATRIRCGRCRWTTYGLGIGPWRCYCGAELKPVEEKKRS
jgi:hypothetical protein